MCLQVCDSSESLLNLSLNHISKWKWWTALPPSPAKHSHTSPTLILVTPSWKEMPELASCWGWGCVGKRVALQHPKYRWEVPSCAAVGLHSSLWQQCMIFRLHFCSVVLDLLLSKVPCAVLFKPYVHEQHCHNTETHPWYKAGQVLSCWSACPCLWCEKSLSWTPAVIIQKELLIALIFLPFVDGYIFAPSLAAEFSNWHHQLCVLMRVYRRKRENMKLLCPGYNLSKSLEKIFSFTLTCS